MRAVDLFCGCGGMSLGFQQAGIDIVAAFENWPFAAACYRNNFKHPVYEIDLSDVEKAVTIIKPYKPELIIGGPPCQDFSNAGNRREGKRADLTLAFARIVVALSPRYFVMENVERASLSQTYANAKTLLQDNGYGLTERVLNACYYGVPQSRKRFFCIGIKDSPNSCIDGMLSSNQSLLPMTVRDYFANNNIELPFEYYYRHPRTYSRRGVFSVDEPAPTIRGVNRPRPVNYQRHKNDVVDPVNVRAMNAYERALIQTFPQNYIWPDSSANTEQMIGNAVPVKLAEHVARTMLAYSQGKTNDKDIRFVDWLIQIKGYSTRAASDVLSRIKRANRIISIEDHSIEDTLQVLEQSDDFSMINKTVQSQIKRALKFYHEYCDREEVQENGTQI